MKVSLNELLLSIPLYELTFITPFPEEEILYEQVVTTIPDQWCKKPTLLLLDHHSHIRRLNEKEVANLLIQDSNLLAIVICHQGRFTLKDEIFSLYEQLHIPIVQMEDKENRQLFYQRKYVQPRYSQLSTELNGFTNRGFMHIATNISFAFKTPMLFLDENKQLLWQTGHDVEMRKALQWVQSIFSKEVEADSVSIENVEKDLSHSSHSNQAFEHYTMNIANQVDLYVIVSSGLAKWQKAMIDKFIGLTAVVFQTDELVREQNERFKELFVYELLYRKFESKKILVKQGKTWGWNLEKAHHLLIVHIDELNDHELDMDWNEEIVFLLETEKEELEEKLIIFPFQEQIVVLIEDDEDRTLNDRKKIAINIAKWIVNKAKEQFPTIKIQAGIGKWYKDTIYLNKSYQEAKVALQVGNTWFDNRFVFHISDIGVHHLLIHVHREILHDFCQEYLGHLLKSDRDNDTEYLKTLKMYIQNKGIVNEVSKALYIHPNTLRNRLKKIEEITGIDLQNLDELMNLMVAVKVYFSFFHKGN